MSPLSAPETQLGDLAIAGAAVLEALGLENAAGSGEPPKGWGQRELTLGDPGAARKLEARAA